MIHTLHVLECNYNYIDDREKTNRTHLVRFKNNPHMSFDNTSLVPEQELELIKDTQGTLEYPLK